MFLKENIRKKNNKAYSYFYIVEGYRDENNKVKQNTVLKIGDVPKEIAQNILKAYKGEVFSNLDDLTIDKTYEYGASTFLDEVWKQSGFNSIIDKKYAYRIKMMVINRLINPRSKNDLINWYNGSIFSKDKLQNEMNYENLYRAMDYLEKNQEQIEEKLNDKKAKTIFYDITSSYFEGNKCEMSAFGYSRDHRRDEKQVVISLAIDENKTPLAIKVLKGNTADVSSVEERLIALKERFKLQGNCIIADKGMVSKSNIEKIIENGFDYILAVKLSNEIKDIIRANEKMEYVEFDDTLKIKEVFSEDKKHIICFSKYKDFTDKESRKSRIQNATLALENLYKKLFKSHDDMVKKVSNIVFRFKVNRFIEITYTGLNFEFKELPMDCEFDGIFVIQTSKRDVEGKVALSQYKNLKTIERCFREIKDFIELRPMYHYKNERVKAHTFICFLSYYIYAMIDKKLSELPEKMSVEILIDKLKTINACEIALGNDKTTKISKIDDDFKEILKELKSKIIAKK